MNWYPHSTGELANRMNNPKKRQRWEKVDQTKTGGRPTKVPWYILHSLAVTVTVMITFPLAQTYFSRGLGPLISILDNLIRFEAGVGLKGQAVELTDKTVKLKLTKSKLDIQAIRISLNKAVRILSLGNAACLQKRKSNLKLYLDRKYHHLVQTSNPGI